MKFSSPYGMVTLTNERKTHILTFHPDITRYFSCFAETLTNPDFAISSVHDSSVVICYRFLAHKKRYLAIVVRTGAHPFILTAYLAKKPRHGIL